MNYDLKNKLFKCIVSFIVYKTTIIYGIHCISHTKDRIPFTYKLKQIYVSSEIVIFITILYKGIFKLHLIKLKFDILKINFPATCFKNKKKIVEQDLTEVSLNP